MCLEIIKNEENNLFSNVKTLRDTLKFSYPIYSDYKRILPYTDLPYNFDQKKKPWWRWYFYASGSYYSRIHVNYSLWYNNHFKKKIGVYMPIVFKMPHKREKRYKPWIKKYYIYENTYKKKINNWINPKNILNLNYNFFNYNYYKSNIITNYAHWKYHNVLRSYKSFFYVGSENEMFISGYNYKWNNLSLRDSLYNEFLINFNYTVPVNYFLMQGSYFINSYDSSIVLHPHSFFNYYEKLNINRVINIKKINKFFYINFNNLLFYNNIIIRYQNIFFDNFIQKLNIYFDKIKNKMINNIYKINILYLFLNKYNILLNSVKLMNNFYNNNILYLFKNKNLLKENIVNTFNNYFIKIYNNKFYKIKNKFLWLNNFIKTKIYKKIIFLYFNVGLNIKNYNFIYYKENISKSFINLISILQKKKSKIYKNFLKNINKIFIYKENIKYKKYFVVNKENLLYKLKIKRFNTYPKIFIKIIDDYRYLYNKITVVKDRSSNSNTFLWSKFLKNYMIYIDNFLYNFFSIFIDLYKINFGYLYNLNTFNKENIDYIDMGFFMEIQIYLYRFFDLLKKKYINNFIYKYIKLKDSCFKYNVFLGKINKYNLKA